MEITMALVFLALFINGAWMSRLQHDIHTLRRDVDTLTHRLDKLEKERMA
jgi:ubiquinone biosynthesis protein UbiJ